MPDMNDQSFAPKSPPIESRSLTEQLAEYLPTTRPQHIPPRVIEASQHYLLDWLGSAIAGTGTKQGSIIISHAAEQKGIHSTVIGLGERSSTQAAAFANGALSHITETDDVHRGAALHPGVAVIPAALAVAERVGSSGIDFLASIALGYEVVIRIGESVGTSHYYYWHNTSTCGPFGSAAAAGWLLGLSSQQMVWALGNAGSLSSGLWQFNEDGAMAKHLHAGHAASSGVLAAELAARDFTGTRFILEGKRGLYAATSKDPKPHMVVSGLAHGMERYKISECVIKPFPSCRHTHAPVDLALELRRKSGLSPEQVERIEVDTYQATLDLTDNANPMHEYAAKFSTQYCVCEAFVLGRLTLADFSSSTRSNPAIRGLMAKTSLRMNPEIQARYPKEWACRVTITSTSGRQFDAYTAAPKGDPENPLSLEELKDKFRSMLAGSTYEAKTEGLIQAVANLHRADGVRGLLR